MLNIFGLKYKYIALLIKLTVYDGFGWFLPAFLCVTMFRLGV
jgi:hypothetical protein